MNIKDFDKVRSLLETLESLRDMSGVVKAEIFGGSYGREEGYNLFMSLYPDGSGAPMDFGGCCVANEVLAATESILLNKISEIEGKLVALGVDMVDE